MLFNKKGPEFSGYSMTDFGKGGKGGGLGGIAGDLINAASFGTSNLLGLTNSNGAGAFLNPIAGAVSQGAGLVSDALTPDVPTAPGVPDGIKGSGLGTVNVGIGDTFNNSEEDRLRKLQKKRKLGTKSLQIPKSKLKKVNPADIGLSVPNNTGLSI